MRSDWQALADEIDAAREARGWSQAALAEQAGVSEKTVWDIMSGRARDRMPRKISRIEHALGWPTGTARRIVFESASPDEQVVEHRNRDVTADEFRALLMLLRHRIEREPNASDADRARWRARVDELEQDMLSDPEEHAS